LTDVILFHHAQGLTDGVRQFAGQMRAAGHQVTTPDLYEGRIFAELPEGLAYVEQTGFDTILQRGQQAAADLPASVVYAGFSLGVMPAQLLTQTKPGARGALFFHSCVPVSEFGTWPDGVPVQIHAMENDPSFTDEGDIDAARDLVKTVADGELFLYPGAGHLFADASLADYDPAAAALLTERALAFLSRDDVAGAR
jgi:dienelactone hydrolase